MPEKPGRELSTETSVAFELVTAALAHRFIFILVFVVTTAASVWFNIFRERPVSLAYSIHVGRYSWLISEHDWTTDWYEPAEKLAERLRASAPKLGDSRDMLSYYVASFPPDRVSLTVTSYDRAAAERFAMALIQQETQLHRDIHERASSLVADKLKELTTTADTITRELRETDGPVNMQAGRTSTLDVIATKFWRSHLIERLHRIRDRMTQMGAFRDGKLLQPTQALLVADGPARRSTAMAAVGIAMGLVVALVLALAACLVARSIAQLVPALRRSRATA